MNKKLVYDIPTRLFHWSFAVLFCLSFAIGNLYDDESAVFAYHMLFGLVLVVVVLWRIGWGMLGTTHARFSGFSLKPADLIAYFRGIATGSLRKWEGHNPASSWAAVTMMTLAIGLGVTGYLMSSGSGSDSLEEVHEVLANAFLVVAILHIAGVAFHSYRHKDEIWKSMLTGEKAGLSLSEDAVSLRYGAGLVFILMTLGISWYIFDGFDKESGTLKILGTSLSLGENEDGEGGEEEHHRHGPNFKEHENERE